VAAKYSQVAHYGDARGVRFDQDLRMLGVAGGVEIGLAHHDPDIAARVHRVRNPPFATVDDIFVAIGCDRQLQIGCVGRGDLRLGHHIG
jgi:hypothetical protein